MRERRRKNNREVVKRHKRPARTAHTCIHKFICKNVSHFNEMDGLIFFHEGREKEDNEEEKEEEIKTRSQIYELVLCKSYKNPNIF